MKLYTDRLVLRRFEEHDLAAFFELARDRETNRFLPFFPPETRSCRGRALHERFLTETGAPADCCYAVCLRADERPIGYVTLMGDAHDLGYALRSDYWGRGIAAEAAAAVLREAEAAGVPFVTATHDVENPRSGRVMQKLGMVYQYSYTERWMPKDVDVVFRLYQKNFNGAALCSTAIAGSVPIALRRSLHINKKENLLCSNSVFRFIRSETNMLPTRCPASNR